MYDYYGRGFVRKYSPSMGFIRRSKSVQLRLELEGYSPQSRIETYQLIAICQGHKLIMNDLLLTCDYQLGGENMARARWPWFESLSKAW